MKNWKSIWARYREQIMYLFFGGLTTLVNLVAYELLDRAGLSTVWATGVATVISILFAYITNRKWVFASRAKGREAWREFGSFIACRLATLVLDVVFMKLTVDVLGVRLIAPETMQWWKRGMKLASNVVVVIVNYIFSKWIIFRGK